MRAQEVVEAAADTVALMLPDTVAVDNNIYIDPLFTYPMAPEGLPDLQSRTDWLMENFWNDFDFKKKDAVDQIALNHAFGVYTESMVYASRKKAEEGVKNLVKKLKDNPTLSYQFLRAAEENMYSPRAGVWADEVYIPFIENLLANKKVSEGRKARYRAQLALLKANLIGAPLPSFNYTSSQGSHRKFEPSKEFTLVEFAGLDCDGCRYSNLKMDISSTVNDLIDDGRLGVLIILPGESVNPDLTPIKNLPEKWNGGVSSDAFDLVDIRINPSFFLLDKNGKILLKNYSIDDIIQYLDAVKQP